MWGVLQFAGHIIALGRYQIKQDTVQMRNWRSSEQVAAKGARMMFTRGKHVHICLIHPAYSHLQGHPLINRVWPGRGNRGVASAHKGKVRARTFLHQSFLAR